MKNFYKKQSKAQGILEVAIAIYIIVVGVLSIINLVVANIRVERYNHNMLIATNLAKEGIEIVRGIRDTNWINGENFDHGMIPGSGSQERTFFIEKNNSGYYVIAHTVYSWEDCVNTPNFEADFTMDPCRIYLSWPETNEDKKSYVNGYVDISNMTLGNIRIFEPTNFYRMIYINPICYISGSPEYIIDVTNANCEDLSGVKKIGMQVISQVGWKEANGMKITRIEERMYDWRFKD